jgi:hypothetical protein
LLIAIYLSSHKEEVNRFAAPPRIFRHKLIFEQVRADRGYFVGWESTEGEHGEPSERLSARETRFHLGVEKSDITFIREERTEIHNLLDLCPGLKYGSVEGSFMQ